MNLSLFVFNVFLWIMGVFVEENVEERIVARGKCREVVVEDKEVKIIFLNEEDAEIFAEDLRELLN